MPPHSTAFRVGSLFLVALFAAVLAYPTLHGEFLLGDDHNLVLEQVFVNHPSLPNAWRLLTMVHSDLYQPLPMLSFQLDYALSGPDENHRFPVSPLQFHLTNMVLHIACSLMAWAVARRLSGCGVIALLTGLLFTWHPLAVEPVAWITGRMILMATAFSLGLLWLCMARPPSGEGRWPVWAWLVWMGALLSKVLPSVPVAAAWCDARVHGCLPRRALRTYAMLLTYTAAATLFAVKTTRDIGASQQAAAEMTTSAPVRMILAGRYYLENYFWPMRLSAWSPPPHAVPLFSTQVAIGLAEWAALMGAAFALRRRAPAVWSGAVLFVILLAPFLAATTARRFLTADRYMYLPMVGLHLMLAALAMECLRGLSRRLNPAGMRVAFAALCMATLGIYGKTDLDQAEVWQDVVRQGLRTQYLHPDDVDVHLQLVKAYIHRNQPDDALKAIEVGRSRWPDNPAWAAQAGEALLLKNDPASAVRELLAAEAVAADRKRVRYKLGLALDLVGRRINARCRYWTILVRDPSFLPAWTALARNLRADGLLDLSAAAYDQALAINPRHGRALVERADIDMVRQDWSAAAIRLETAVKMDPRSVAARLKLAIARRYQQRFTDALELLDALVAESPKSSAALLNRAGVYWAMGRTTEAEADYRAAVAAAPSDRNAAIAFHEFLLNHKRYVELIPLWDTAVGNLPAEGDAPAWRVWAYALAGRTDAAGRFRDAIPQGNPHRPFADWAMVYIDLAAGRLDAWPTRFESNVTSQAAPITKQAPSITEQAAPITEQAAPITRQEQGRAVLVALSDLPDAVKHTPSGLAALAAACSFKGEAAMSEAALSQLKDMPDSQDWIAVVRRLSQIGEPPESPAPGN